MILAGCVRRTMYDIWKRFSARLTWQSSPDRRSGRVVPAVLLGRDRKRAELYLAAEWVRIPVLLIHTTVKRASRVQQASAAADRWQCAGVSRVPYPGGGRRTALKLLPPPLSATPLADCSGRRFMEEIMTTVAQMTKDELREMIETTVEQKLLELLGDPDEGLPVRKAVRDRLLRQKQAVAGGERGEQFEDVVRRLGLE